jgi:hypothetical protein
MSSPFTTPQVVIATGLTDVQFFHRSASNIKMVAVSGYTALAIVTFLDLGFLAQGAMLAPTPTSSAIAAIQSADIANCAVSFDLTEDHIVTEPH